MALPMPATSTNWSTAHERTRHDTTQHDTTKQNRKKMRHDCKIDSCGSGDMFLQTNRFGCTSRTPVLRPSSWTSAPVPSSAAAACAGGSTPGGLSLGACFSLSPLPHPPPRMCSCHRRSSSRACLQAAIW